MHASATFAKRDATVSKISKRRLPSTAEIKVVNKAIKKTLKELDPAAYQYSLSIPGIDPVMAAEILSEIVGSMRSSRRSLWRNTLALSSMRINHISHILEYNMYQINRQDMGDVNTKTFLVLSQTSHVKNPQSSLKPV